jgi:hypothetical protein
MRPPGHPPRTAGALQLPPRRRRRGAATDGGRGAPWSVASHSAVLHRIVPRGTAARPLLLQAGFVDVLTWHMPCLWGTQEGATA